MGTLSSGAGLGCDALAGEAAAAGAFDEDASTGGVGLAGLRIPVETGGFSGAVAEDRDCCVGGVADEADLEAGADTEGVFEAGARVDAEAGRDVDAEAG